jgi:Lon protease-like protein
MILPLHIFEPRYKLMIGKCIEENTPFGVVLIRSGQEVGAAAEPYQIGTSAHIRKVDQLSDGRMNIECVGYQRFKIREISATEPYMVGQIEPLPPFEGEAALIPQKAAKLRGLLPNYLNLIARATGKPASVDPLPEQGDALAYWTAIVAPLDNADKQTLLECERLADLLDAEVMLIRKEIMFLNALLFAESNAPDNSAGFSLN